MLDFASKLAARETTAAGANARTDQPKAKVWMNIGYYVAAPTAEDPEATKFVSLPMGLPIDTMQKVKTNSSNQDFAALRTAQNELLDLLIEAGLTLQPGQDEIVNLQVQLRRVNDEQKPVDPESNPYSITENGRKTILGLN